ncbi:hypothetical protein V8F06_011248 [Rhypophila decipiens]
MAVMDVKPRTTSFGFFTRPAKGQRRFVARTNTSSPLALWSTSTTTAESSSDEKGALGLTTLHEPTPPSEPVADIVFIHGLGGGSRKTWSFSSDPQHYWPQAWLPDDGDFSDVRIHTFGYKADWAERKQSVLDIHGFSQILLGALRNHPAIRRSRTRVIFVGHSMGGCVAKKTYILARQDPTASDIASRIHSMFFLGTPHRGSDLAAVLENMLAVTWGKKPFVGDLTPNSSVLAAINDSFRHYAPDLRLWSFYETLPVRGGMMNRIVVDQHSATLGYHNEEIAPMHADHRQVCKFETRLDPNYNMLRNALLTAIDTIRSSLVLGTVHTMERPPHDRDGCFDARPKLSPAEALSLLRAFLGSRDLLEGDLFTLQILKQPGSCEWFTNRPEFQDWKSGKGTGILWLMGRPATGKSVISCHVIEQLTPLDSFCSYLICKHSKTGDSTISECFRSLAFQMAVQDDMLANDELSWDKNDDSSVWRRLFVGCIFKLPSVARHFWVLDGVNECAGYSALFTKRFLAAMPDGLRLFATSRGLEEIERGLSGLGVGRDVKKASIYTLSGSDTLHDMKLFVASKLEELGRPESLQDREDMCEKMLAKSRGSFLWARLVLQQFEDAWTEEAMEAVLEEIPPDLFDLYSHMAQSILSNGRKTTLARSIISWIALSTRPLTMDELRCAVKLEMGQTLQNPARAIPDICAQLVYIDKNARAHFIHETVREFLLQQHHDFALAVDKKEGHTTIASILLKYICSGVLKSQQTGQSSIGRTRGFARPAVATAALDMSLLSYAVDFFSEHIFRATSADDCLMGMLCGFFRTTTVLEWIDKVAGNNDLTAIPRTSMNLREYLGRRTKYAPPADPSIQMVDKWITDLIRVTAKFRAQLLTCPSSIHCLIPPLCPTDSPISRTFGQDSRPSSRLSTLRKGQTTTVSHGDRFFAIGLSNGGISLYTPASMQCVNRMLHPERVKILEFGPEDVFLASCGAKRLVVWEPKAGAMIYSFPIQSPPLCLTFLGVDELLCAFQSSELTKLTLGSGEHQTISWREVDCNVHQADDCGIPAQPPSRATFLVTVDHVLMAVGYRGHPVMIWNALELRLLGVCDVKTGNNGITDMVFNVNPEIPVLTVSYQDGTLAVFDYTTMGLQVRPDGQSLLAGTNQGAVEVFEFEVTHTGVVAALTPLYCTNHPLDSTIRGVAFSGDGLRFVDVRSQQARVWAPAALVRRGMILEDPEITSPLVSTADGSVIIAGRSNGDVVLFAKSDARPKGVLYQHRRGTKVVCVAISSSGKVVASADDSARVLFVQLDQPLTESSASQQLRKGNVILDSRFDGAISGILLNKAADKILITGRYTDQLWEIGTARAFSPGGQVVAVTTGLAATSLSGAQTPHRPASPGPLSPAVEASHWPSSRSIFQHSGNLEWFVIFADDRARIFSWLDFTDLTELTDGIALERPVQETDLPLETRNPNNHLFGTPNSRSTSTCVTGPGYVVELFRSSSTSSPRVYLWTDNSLVPASSHSSQTTTTQKARRSISPANEPNLTAISPNVLSIVGFSSQSTLLFLDVNLWLCSVDLQTAAATTTLTPRAPPRPPLTSSFSAPPPASISSSSGGLVHARRHLFALSEWRNSAGEMRCAVVGGSGNTGVGSSVPSPSLVFANGQHHGGVVVINGGLEFSENVVVARSVTGTSSGGGGGASLSRGGGQGDIWAVVGGSMHRRG